MLKINKKATLVSILLILIWSMLAINGAFDVYKTSQNKYLLIQDADVYRASFVGTPDFKFESRGVLRQGVFVYRIEDAEAYQEYLPDYYYVDTHYLQRGSFQGYVEKSALKKVEKKE